ncbi:MAG: DNA-3-methyladenine glycosylase [Cyclobacteriaceae bacterium]|nr:DNA-3-methyladenine glycosylase [Cyclobacteriaceae bacterium]
MHIDRSWNGLSLMEQKVWIETDGLMLSQQSIQVSKRIGIDYAGADANLPWRFSVKDNPWVSRVK